MKKILAYSMHGTDPWWRHVLSGLSGHYRTAIVSDTRGCGDIDVTPSFYEALRSGLVTPSVIADIGQDTCNDIILRCRVLRCLPKDKAMQMVGAMWLAFSDTIREQAPDLILSFCIDRYVMDVMARVGTRMGIPFVEMTVSPVPDYLLFMSRGTGLAAYDPSEDEIESAVTQLTDPRFAPAYVKNETTFGLSKFLKVFLYFEARGAFFNLCRYLRRDSLNCHYLDSQKWLDHKLNLRDLSVLKQPSTHWQGTFAGISPERRAFVGLQLFPEASLDYWIENPELLAHDEAVVRQCSALTNAGFHVFVKDHPLMYGFRKKHLIERILKIPGVTLVPYEVSGRFLLEECYVTATFTGTVGLEAALVGRCCVCARAGYYYLPDDMVSFGDLRELDTIGMRAKLLNCSSDMRGRQRRLIDQILKCSAPGRLTRVSRFGTFDASAVEDANAVAQSILHILPKLYQSAVASLLRPGEQSRHSDCTVPDAPHASMVGR